MLKNEQIKIHAIQFSQPHKAIQLQKKLKDLIDTKARMVLDYCHAYSVNIREDKTVSIQELVTAAESDELSNDQKKQADKDLDLI